MQTFGWRWVSAAAVLCLNGCFDPDGAGPAAAATAGTDGGSDESEGDGDSGGEADDDSDSVEDEGTTTGAAMDDEGSSTTWDPSQLRSAEVQNDGLETLSGGFHYELWAIIDGAPATVGKFNIDAGGVVVDLDGIAVPDALFDAGRDLREATDFVLTIETAGDVDITPGVSKYLAGPLEGETSVMVVGDGRALGDDYANAAGQYILATPTDGPDTSEEAGVWWLDLSVDPPAPGLVLPELPEGWEYEGWAVIDGVPVTTGRFRGTNVPDFDDPFSGTMPGPNVPGEDFLTAAPDGLQFPADLRGRTVVVSIEPEPDDSDAPFTLKPLVADVNPVAATHQSMAMDAQPETFPTATVLLMQ